MVTALATTCAQLIVLSHDAYFLREIRDGLSRIKPAPITPCVVGVNRVQGDYSAFSSCDIDEICASEYYRHHQDVRNYVDGVYPGKLGDVAKALRPLLEGFYHRRFPGLLPKRCMFGQVIDAIDKAMPASPLSHMQPQLQELREVNAYANRFHHDTDAALEITAVTDGQLKPYAVRALDLIYKG